MRKRFLRDGVLDAMLNDICIISEKVPEQESEEKRSLSIAPMVELYETNKIVLQYLEDVIDDLREGISIDIVIEKVVKAAAHMQIGCVSAHNSLQELYGDECGLKIE